MEHTLSTSVKQQVDYSDCISDELLPTSSYSDIQGAADERAVERPLAPVSSPASDEAGSRSVLTAEDLQSTREAMRNTMEYLMKVQLRFAFRDDLYQEFLSILRVIHHPPVDKDQLSQRIATLFQDSPDLLSGLQQFIPREVIDIDTIIVGEKIKNLDINESTVEPVEGNDMIRG